jgi:hypothetical protein
MVDQAKITNFRGVLCSRCKEPIPVSAVVLGLLDEIEHKPSSVSRCFSLRCKRCGEEGVYSPGDTRNFEGEPRVRMLNSYGARRSKAATA